MMRVPRRVQRTMQQAGCVTVAAIASTGLSFMVGAVSLEGAWKACVTAVVVSWLMPVLSALHKDSGGDGNLQPHPDLVATDHSSDEHPFFPVDGDADGE